MELKLEVPKRTWSPDEKLDVVLLVRTPQTVETEITVTPALYVKSIGDDYRSRASGGLRRKMTIEPGTHRYPLTLDLPNGPFTYRGTSLGVFWYILVEAKVDGESFQTSVPIELKYAPNALPAPRAPHGPGLSIDSGQAARNVKVALLLTFLLFMGFAAMVLAYLAVTVSPIFLLAFLPLAAFSFLARRQMYRVKETNRRAPEARLVVEPEYVSPGERQTVYVQIETKKDLEIRGIVGGVELIETTQLSAPANYLLRSERHQRRTREKYLKKKKVALRASLDFGQPSAKLEAGESRTFATSIKLPDDAPVSMQLGKNEVRWAMRIVVQTDQESIEIRRNLFVLPTPESQSEDTNPVAREAQVATSDAFRIEPGEMDRDEDEEVVFDHGFAEDASEPELVEEPFVEEVDARG